MKFAELEISGAYLWGQKRHAYERGFFARQFCRHELAAVDIEFDIKQCNLSKNYRAGALRCMHYQDEPYPEIKLVSCMRGRCYDVIVGLSLESKTYLRWISSEHSHNNGRDMYIPQEWCDTRRWKTMAAVY